MRKIKRSSFVITKDHLENESLDLKEINALKKEGYVHHFKIYDDDDILYFSGYYKEDLEEEEVFNPLDWAMNDSGAVRIDYRDKITGKYETL